MEIDYEEFKEMFVQHRNRLLELKKNKEINIAEHLRSGNIDDMIKNGLDNIGLYHPRRPIMLKNGKILTEDLATLYYYHNRTDGYDLQ